jgi:hypothetical protein
MVAKISKLLIRWMTSLHRPNFPLSFDSQAWKEYYLDILFLIDGTIRFKLILLNFIHFKQDPL